MKKFALRLSGVIFLLVAALHLYRYYYRLQVTFDHFAIPVDWSLYAGVIVLVLSIFMFIAAKR